jgi:hypothetical protein
MGQYLAIGLVVECKTSKNDLLKYKITMDDLTAKMKNKLHFCPEIYDFSETDDDYIFKLKSNILESQLLPLLEKFYPLVYLDSNINYEDTLEMLRISDPSTWLELASEKSREEFQLDKYAHCDYLYFDKAFKPTAKIYYKVIMLSMEGKILMEVFGRQFSFFKYCIQESFFEFSLAKALRVYITG